MEERALAETPWNWTLVVPEKPEPEMVTSVPTEPELGVKPVILGRTRMVNEVALVAVPAGVVTEIGPLVATLGTVASISPSLATLKEAAVPLNLTAVAPVKFVPVITTDVPTAPLDGVKDAMVGGSPPVLQELNLNAPIRVCQFRPELA